MQDGGESLYGDGLKEMEYKLVSSHTHFPFLLSMMTGVHLARVLSMVAQLLFWC